MYFRYKIQNTYMYFKYVFQIIVFEILPSTDCESSPGSRDGCRAAPGGCRPLDQAD